MAAFVLKADRGRVNVSSTEGLLGLNYWVERNFNQVKDQSILGFEAGQALRKEMMANSTLRRHHDEAVTWRHARFEELMYKEATRDLMGRLLHAPPSRLLPPNEAKFLMAHAIAQAKSKS